MWLEVVSVALFVAMGKAHPKVPPIAGSGRVIERDRTAPTRQVGPHVGDGVLAHATASVNRASIERWGPDWRHMGAAPGIAGSSGPELEAVFLDTQRQSSSSSR